MEKTQKGITLLALMVTIVVLLILAGVGFASGKETIQKAKLEELKTNMLLIQAKAREYVEEATFKMGIKPDDEKKIQVREAVYGSGDENGAKLSKAETIPAEFGIEDTTTCYWLTPEAQEKWGLSKMQMGDNERYLIKFDEETATVEVYNTEGYDGKYSLTQIDQIEK